MGKREPLVAQHVKELRRVGNACNRCQRFAPQIGQRHGAAVAAHRVSGQGAGCAEATAERGVRSGVQQQSLGGRPHHGT